MNWSSPIIRRKHSLSKEGKEFKSHKFLLQGFLRLESSMGFNNDFSVRNKGLMALTRFWIVFFTSNGTSTSFLFSAHFSKKEKSQVIRRNQNSSGSPLTYWRKHREWKHKKNREVRLKNPQLALIKKNYQI